MTGGRKTKKHKNNNTNKYKGSKKSTSSTSSTTSTSTAAWFSSVESAEDLELEHVAKVYHLNEPICSSKRHKKGNCVSNPNCFQGLEEFGEQQNGHNDELIAPNYEEKGGSPIGLLNLGATCYMNVLLQCLFSNTTFRQGIYDYKPDESKRRDPTEDPCLQMQILFTKLQFGKIKSIDPSDFTKSIALKTSIQQDPQEFFKLLITMLETGYDTHPALKAMLLSQFQGKYKYTTTCMKCNTSSHTESDFYEMELNIKGNSTLQECLQDYTKEEKLTGEDQYYCSVCQSKQDAIRKITLCNLPELMRFVYDMKTLKKKKLRTNVRFPMLLNMKDFLNESNDAEYNLSAVLIHKGTSAYGGHYIAHIRDERADKWWTFDDTNVQEVKGNSLEQAHLDQEKSEQDQQPKGKRKNLNEASAKGVTGSCNAYMLIYTKNGRKFVADPQIRPEILETVQHEMDNAVQALKDFEKLKSEEEKRTKDHEQLCESVMKTIAVKPAEEEYFWVPTSWLSDWLHGKTDKMDFQLSMLLCEHKKVNPHQITRMKRVSKVAWQYFEQYSEGTVLSNIKGDLFPCTECCLAICKTYQETDDKAKTKKEKIEIINNESPDQGYWISKAWFQEWKKKDDVSSSLDEDILCRHGKRITDKSKCVLVSNDIFNWLISNFEGNAITEVCPDCAKEEEEQLELEHSRREERDAERKKLQELYKGPQLKKKTDSATYVLVYLPWVQKWKAFIDDLTINERPPLVSNAELLCKHGDLKYDPSVFYGATAVPETNIMLVSEQTYLELVQSDIHAGFITCQQQKGECITSPHVCTKGCVAEQRQLDFEAKLNYTDKEMYIITKSEAASTRNTRSRSRKVLPNVNSTDTLHDLKLKICQLLFVIPIQQKLSLDDKPLEGDDLTLAQHGILAGSVLTLDTIEEIEEAGKEEGFKGTALYSFAMSSYSSDDKEFEDELEEQLLKKQKTTHTLPTEELCT